MKNDLLKRLPTVVVSVLGIVCALPYLTADESQVASTQTAADSKEKASATEKPEGKDQAVPKTPKPSLQKLLRPRLEPRPLRDPFKDPAVLEAETKALVAATLKDFFAKNLLKTSDGRSPGSAKNSRSKSAKTTAAEKAKSSSDLLAALSLDATYVWEGRGAAMINGEHYRPGDALRCLNGTPPCIVSVVNRDYVLVDYGGQNYSLAYKSADRKVSPASRKTAKPPIKPRGGGPKR